MKSSTTKNEISPCVCGGDEFITRPNRYDIYRLTDGELHLQKSEPIEDDTLYCRNCGRRLATAG